MNNHHIIIVLLFLLYICSSCKNNNTQTSTNIYNHFRDSTQIYKPEIEQNFNNTLFYEYNTTGMFDRHLSWDIYAHTLYFASPAPVDFFGNDLKLKRMPNHYAYYMANCIYDYQISQEGTFHDPLYFDVYFAFLYPHNGSELIFVGDHGATPDMGDLLIGGKTYIDTNNIGDFIVEYLAAKDSLFNAALKKAPYPFKIQKPKQRSADKSIEYIELYTYKFKNLKEAFVAPWHFATATENINLTPQRFYDIHKKYISPIKIEDKEDIGVMLDDSIEETESYVYFIIRLIYDDGSSSLRAISDKNRRSLDIISTYILDKPWESPLSIESIWPNQQT